jgi:hypothetical protein
MLETLREDFARLPELLALGAPEQPSPSPAQVPDPVEPAPTPAAAEEPPTVDQLGLF